MRVVGATRIVGITSVSAPLPPDTTAPTVSDGALSASNVTVSSFNVDFAKATDDRSPQSALVYKLYTSLSDNVSTVVDAEANGTLQDTQTDVTQLSATGLGLNTYYYNVVVEDQAGNKSAYTAASQSTSFDPEANLGTPDETENPGTFDWTPPASGSENVVFAFDVILPSTPPTSGMIFEQGGSGRGIILLVRNGHLRFRFGDGGSPMTTVPTQGFVGSSNSSDAKYIWDVPVAELPFDGSQHTIVWEVVCEQASSPNIGHRAWCDGELLFESKSSNRVEGDDWSGSASGGFLNGGTNMPDEVNYDDNWPDQTSTQEIRLYLNKSVT